MRENSEISKEDYLKAKKTIFQYEKNNNFFELDIFEKRATEIIKERMPNYIIGGIFNPETNKNIEDENDEEITFYIRNGVARNWDNLPLIKQGEVNATLRFLADNDRDDD